MIGRLLSMTEAWTANDYLDLTPAGADRPTEDREIKVRLVSTVVVTTSDPLMRHANHSESADPVLVPPLGRVRGARPRLSRASAHTPRQPRERSDTVSRCPAPITECRRNPVIHCVVR